MTHRQSCANEHAIQRSFTVGTFASRAASPEGVNCKLDPSSALIETAEHQESSTASQSKSLHRAAFIVAPKFDESVKVSFLHRPSRREAREAFQAFALHTLSFVLGLFALLTFLRFVGLVSFGSLSFFRFFAFVL